MAYGSLAVSCEIYRLKFSCILLLTLLLHFVLLLYSFALKFKNYSYRIDAYVRHLNDIGAVDICHHIFTIMCNTTDDFNKIDVKVSFNAKQDIYKQEKMYKTVVCIIYIHLHTHTHTHVRI